MKLPRDLSGREFAERLQRAFGYQRVHQGGSHMVLESPSPQPRRVAVPDHKVLRVDTSG